MKVFLSWSGTQSHRVACVLRDWLPSVIQSIVPYVSSEDIDKGARWSTDIAKELESSHYGVICVTQENVSAPWINFEAGALSKSLDKANVTPLLIDIKRSDVKGPLLQFQSVIIAPDEMLKLVSSINNRISEKNRLTDTLLTKAFNVWWPMLKAQLDGVEKHAEAAQAVPAPVDEKAKILEELLELARQQQRVLNNPEVLLPPDYLSFVLQHLPGSEPRRDPRFEHAFDLLHHQVMRLESLLSSVPDAKPELLEAAKLVDNLHHHLHVLEAGSKRRRARLSERIGDQAKAE